ncbi:FAD/NAD-binding domain-containing protein [Phellopilus nigrolimitatus]|nr:FAD/NAD-binding domain-containing protein [Phellopilus nigrolimitatus]
MSTRSATSTGRLCGVASTRTRLSLTRQPQVRAFSASAARATKQRLVILGSGWGGYEVLRGVDKKRWDVTIISASSYFNFTPLLASCAVGTLEFRCAIEPVRRYASQATTYQAWCDKIDFQQKTLACVPATPLPSRFERPQIISAPSPVQNAGASDSSTAAPPLALPTQAQTVANPRGFKVHYDKLVIAVGCYSQTFNVPGVKEYAYFLKDVRDARAIRSRILECFEEASQPTLSDLHDLLASDIKRHFGAHLARLARITLYDVADRVLGGFESGLASYAERKFARDGINIKLRHHVEKVEDGVLHVKERGEVPFGVLVWSTGLAANPLIKSIEELQKDAKTGSLLTDENLRVVRTDGKSSEDVWAIGDAAIIKSDLLPATAQVASQKAKYVTRVLNRLARERSLPEPAVLAYLGDWKALYDRTSVESGPKGKEAGRLAWLLWRSAYFTRTLSIRNKITVPYYWFLNWIFGRDLTRF